MSELNSTEKLASNIEIERKFLIKRPTDEQLLGFNCISIDEIVQTYLVSKDKAERRVRKRGNKSNGYKYYYTEKIDIKDGERQENEKEITIEDYNEYLKEKDNSLHQIIKNRYCFNHDGRLYELDIFNFSDTYAILEIELYNINEKLNLPDIDIIKEVTNDKRYKNKHIAKCMSLVYNND